MNVTLIVITLLLSVLLVLIAAIRIQPHMISHPELRRRAGAGSREAERILEREERLSELVTVLWLDAHVTLLLAIIFAILGFGWGWGIFYSLILVLTYGALARTSLARTVARSLWRLVEPAFIKGSARIRPVLATLRVDTLVDAEVYRTITSRHELERLIELSPDALNTEERRRIVQSLRFPDVKVRTVMTPRAAVDSIKGSEFLGPLVLSELHEKGHSRLPVIGEDLNHVIGILHIRDLLSLDDKKSTTAQKAMDPKVYYIHEEDGLEHALSAFLKTRRHLFVVINAQRETVGLLSLEDVLETLMGRSIIDEDDIHGDLHAVAEQRGAHNNRPKAHVDL